MKSIGKSLVIIFFTIVLGFIYIASQKESPVVDEYCYATYKEKELGVKDFFADNLCVSSTDIDQNNFVTNDEFHGFLLADLDAKEFLVSENLHDKIYPASTTKLMTLYVALKYAPDSNIVTVSDNAVDIPWDSSKAWLESGDELEFHDLLYGLMLPSGNDAALAVAEAVAGSVDEFVNLMNKEARELGATNTHFKSPHGYHHKKHYTTPYDLYLILNAAIKNEAFCKIVSEDVYTCTITSAYGYERNVTWYQTNQFINGPYETPDGIEMVGGKTGTTDQAGACLTLYVRDESGKDYIAIMMGANDKPTLYSNMTNLLAVINE